MHYITRFDILMFGLTYRNIKFIKNIILKMLIIWWELNLTWG